MMQSIPLNKLRLSDRNVRKTNREEGIESLAEDIASRGLKQNLVVTESREKKGHYEVDAGGRRFLALQLLAKAKRIPANQPVPCLVEAWEQAHETSLAENLHRVAMNPADEYQAFATVIADYADSGITDEPERISNCARRFGVTVRHVEQRLRLAALAPEILDALREGRITVDAAKSYAAHPDHKQQLKVFKVEERKGSWGHGAKAIRDALVGKSYPVDHPAVRYVGLDAYRAAGGRIQADLFFGSEDREILLDPSIIDRLAAKRTAEDATHFAQEDGWAGGAMKPWSGPTWQDAPAPKGFKRAWADPEKLSEEERGACIRPFKIAEDGSTLEPLSYYFVPVEEGQQSPTHGGYQPETPEARAAREREETVQTIALRLAAPQVAGTPLEGRAFWPPRGNGWVEAEAEHEEGGFVVALLVRVSAEEVGAVMAAAEAQYDRELAELAEEEAAEEAEAAAAEGGEQAEDVREEAPLEEPVA